MSYVLYSPTSYGVLSAFRLLWAARAMGFSGRVLPLTPGSSFRLVVLS